MGVTLAGLAGTRFLQREMRVDIRRTPGGLIGVFLAGLAFAIGWSPCIGPTLASILLLAGEAGMRPRARSCCSCTGSDSACRSCSSGCSSRGRSARSRSCAVTALSVMRVAGALLVVAGVLLALGELTVITRELTNLTGIGKA